MAPGDESNNTETIEPEIISNSGKQINNVNNQNANNN